MTQRILIVAGEASGDQAGAALVKAVIEILPDAEFLGMGGDKMREAGVDIRVDAGPLAVMGLVEVLRHIKPIYAAWNVLKKILLQEPLDLVVLIDYPGFNLRFAKIAKKAGIKVLYYFSPQIWAWHRSRIKIIKERVDKMLVVFPFEETVYKEHGVPVEYVGHPLAQKVHADVDIATMRKKLGIEDEMPIVGLLPGSRKNEIQRLLPVMLEAAKLLKQRYSNLVFVLPLASTLSSKDLEVYVSSDPVFAQNIRLVPDQFYNTVQLCSAAIVTSGTATLETALLSVPLIVVYKTAPITYWIAKKVIKIPYIGLCNIVAGQEVAKELIQEKATPEILCKEISTILDDAAYSQTIRQKLDRVRERLGEGGGTQRAARELVELLSSK